MSNNPVVITVDGTPFFRKMDGVSRYSVDLVTSLAKKYPSIQLCITAFIDTDITRTLLPNLPNIVYVRIPLPQKVYRALFKLGIAPAVDRFLPKNTQLHLAPNFVSFPQVKKYPTALFIHDLAYLDVPETLDQKNKRFLEKFIPLSVDKAADVYATSRPTQERLNTLFPRKNIGLVSNGLIDTKPRTGKPGAHILAVGTTEPRKNLGILINAYRKLPDELKRRHPLIIAGRIEPGWSENLNIENENIQITGFIQDDELTKLYKTARLFVFPSKYEGFGIPVLEALRLGIPSILSDIPVFKEIAQGTASYCPPGDDRAWSTAIAKELKKEFKTNKSGQARIKSYSWSDSIKNLRIPKI